MLSILNRIRACVPLCALIALFVVLFITMSIAPSVSARVPKPHEQVPGDGEDITGMKDPATGGSAEQEAQGADELFDGSYSAQGCVIHPRILYWYWYEIIHSFSEVYFVR